MSWENLDLTSIPTGFELLPKGSYVFSILPGAKRNDKDRERVDFTLAVASGEFVGKRLYVSFPNPDEYTWSPTTFSRLVEAVGTPVEPTEQGTDGVVAYLNRVANLHVGYDVIHKADKAGVERANINLFKPRPATV